MKVFNVAFTSRVEYSGHMAIDAENLEQAKEIALGELEKYRPSGDFQGEKYEVDEVLEEPKKEKPYRCPVCLRDGTEGECVCPDPILY